MEIAILLRKKYINKLVPTDHDESIQDNMNTIKNIQIPQKPTIRGRPKHSLTTTPMGLPKRRANPKVKKDKAIPFIKQSLDF